MQEDDDAQLILDLMRQAIAAPSSPAPGSPWVQGNHNIVVSGGSVSIHLSASAFTASKDSRSE